MFSIEKNNDKNIQETEQENMAKFKTIDYHAVVLFQIVTAEQK